MAAGISQARKDFSTQLESRAPARQPPQNGSPWCLSLPSLASLTSLCPRHETRQKSVLMFLLPCRGHFILVSFHLYPTYSFGSVFICRASAWQAEGLRFSPGPVESELSSQGLLRSWSVTVTLLDNTD